MLLRHRALSRRIRRDDESGLALLDVLLGMAIFALIAVIAVQAMGMFRQRAYVTQATSDVKTAATGIEAALTKPGGDWASTGLPTTAGDITTTVKGLGANVTGANKVNLVSYDAAAKNYVLCVEGTDGAWASYSSAKGAIDGTGRQGGCTITPAGPPPATNAGTGDIPCPSAKVSVTLASFDVNSKPVYTVAWEMSSPGATQYGTINPVANAYGYPVAPTSQATGSTTVSAVQWFGTSAPVPATKNFGYRAMGPAGMSWDCDTSTITLPTAIGQTASVQNY